VGEVNFKVNASLKYQFLWEAVVGTSVLPYSCSHFHPLI